MEKAALLILVSTAAITGVRVMALLRPGDRWMYTGYVVVINALFILSLTWLSE